MKKFSIFAALLSVTLLFSACGETSAPSDAPAVSEGIEEVPEVSESGSITDTENSTLLLDKDLPVNSPENQAYVDKYFEPLAVTGFFRYSFSPSDMTELLFSDYEPPLKTIFSVFYIHDYPEPEIQLTDMDTEVPGDVFEGTLMSHLNLMAEEIRESCVQYYNEETKTYTAAFGLGGGPGYTVITDSKQEGNKRIFAYDMYGMDYDKKVDGEYPWTVFIRGILEIEIDGDQYKYISNAATILH